MASNYSPKIVTDGLVLCLDAADKNSFISGSTTWSDLSGNGNDGTLSGSDGPTVDSNGHIRFNENTSGNAATINSNYMDISLSSQISMYNISFWHKPDALYQDAYPGYYPTLFYFESSTASMNGGPWTGGAANETFHLWGPGGEMTYIKDDISADWHYFTWNWNGSIYDFYLDGEQKTTYNGTNGDGQGVNSILSVTSFRLANNKSTYSARGYFDIIHIYNSQQTLTNISQNFNAQRSRFGV